MAPLIDPRTGRPPIDRRRRATLGMGVTGHRDLVIDGAAAKALAATLERVFANLRDALARAADEEPSVFSPACPVLRTVCTGADGVDALAMQAARAAGSAITWVLPFGGEGTQAGSDPAAAPSIEEPADTRLVL